MTSTDSSTSNNNTNQNNSTSEPSAALDLSSKAAMTNETNNESQQSIDSSSPEARPQENTNHSDISNLNSSEASSSFSSSASPASSSSPTSTNDAPTAKTQAANDVKSSENNKASKNNNNKSNSNSNQKKSTKNNNKSTSANSSIEHSPVAPQQPNHTQYVNYYPAYVPRQGGPQNNAPNAVPYTQLDGAPHAWPQAMAAAAMAAMTDPMQIATYMNNAPNSVGPLPYQSANPNEFNQQHYDQFSFGFTPAFGFGYNGNGTIDYAALQAAQQAPHLNPQSNQWTPSANSSTTPTPIATGVNTTTTSATTAATATTTNPTSSPANTTTSSNDTTSSVPSTANSEASASNSKWIQVISDPLAINEFNVFQHHHQQLSPGDMYTHQPHYNNYRSHHYQRHHQHMQPNYHHYQYNNLYQMPHYGNQYMQNPVPQHHHYNHNKYNKYNNSYSNSSNNNNNHTGFHDNNNNSRKSNNLNNTDSMKTMKDQEMEMNEEQFEQEKSNIESKAESNGSKSWASIVGVPNNTNTSKKNTSASNSQPTSRGSLQETNETSNEQTNNTKKHHQVMSNQSENNKSTNFSSEHSGNTNGNSNYNKSKNNNYSKIRQQQNNNNNIESSTQQVFDVTNLSFPPIGADIASIKAELKESSKQSNKKYDNTVSAESNYNNGNNTITMNAQNFYQNSKKQQQYNNYQRHQQQQFNLPIGKFQNYQNGTINYSFNPKSTYYSNDNGTESPVQQRNERGDRSEKPYKSDFYNKRHQPTQHTLSSFLNIVDKTKFNEKSKEVTKQQAAPIATNGTRSVNAADATKTSVENSDSAIEQLAEQTVNLHIEQPQLVVYTNPSAYNPKEFNTSPKAARFFVIKSYSEDDIHRSIKYNIWCSTEHGNRRLDSAYFKGDAQVPVYLFFSVNGSGHFCGMAEMQSRVDYNKKTGVWSQDKWRGCFQVKWIYVKDVPNSLLRNIKLENNDNKPVTNSRDTQEIPYDKGRQVLKVFHTYNHSSSILDDFEHYERKQEEGKAILNAPHNNYEQGSMNFVEKPEYIQQSVNNIKTNDEIHQDANVEQAKQEIQDTTASSPSTSSSSSTSSIDESKQQEQHSSSSKPLEQAQTSTQLISPSS